MSWTIVEEQQEQALVKPPGASVVWEDVPANSWVWLETSQAFVVKRPDGSAVCADGVYDEIDAECPCFPCPPDWRFEARVVGDRLRFAPMVEQEQKAEWFNGDDLDAVEDGALVSDSDGGWHVVDGGSLTSLVRSGDCDLFRRPRGPVTLTYTPPALPST
jgi:hypothetical protein